MSYYCPACSTDDRPVAIKARNSMSIQWRIDIEGREAIFTINCCPMCATMCSMLPTMKQALLDSEHIQHVLAKYKENHSSIGNEPLEGYPTWGPPLYEQSGFSGYTGPTEKNKMTPWDEYVARLKAEWEKRNGRSGS